MALSFSELGHKISRGGNPNPRVRPPTPAERIDDLHTRAAMAQAGDDAMRRMQFENPHLIIDLKGYKVASSLDKQAEEIQREANRKH